MSKSFEKTSNSITYEEIISGILDEEGMLIGRFGPKTLPNSEDIIKLIEQ